MLLILIGVNEVADARNVSSAYTPKTLYELESCIASNPNAVIIAGCTDRMSRLNYSVERLGIDGISVMQIPELSRIVHGDRYLEVGSAVTIQQLLTAGVHFLPKEVYNAIENIGSTILRDQATIGGALCTRDIRFSLSCILATIGATCEIKIITRKKGRLSKFKTSTHWIELEKLYEEDGSLVYPKDVIITKVRIPVQEDAIQVFRTIGDPKQSPRSSVIFGFQYSLNQATITNPTICIVLPKGGFLINTVLDSSIVGFKLPMNLKKIQTLSSEFIEYLIETCPEVSDLQCERVKRLIETELYMTNSKYLAG